MFQSVLKQRLTLAAYCAEAGSIQTTLIGEMFQLFDACNERGAAETFQISL